MSETSGTLSAGRVGRPHGLDGSFYVTRPRARLLELGTRAVKRAGNASDNTSAAALRWLGD